MLGYVSEISPEQVAALHSQGYRGGDTIGQTGIESYYDRYLRGTAGVSQLRVDSLGRPISLVVPKVPAHPGNAVRLTLDVKLQKAAEEALRYGIERARNSAVLRLLVLERRRDRRARSERRLDPRARVVPDVSAVALCRSRAPAGARHRRSHAAHGRGDELPGARPRDQRRVSTGLDVQARHGDRGDARAHPAAVRAPRLHRLLREERHDLQELGSLRERGDDSADGAREIVRHLLLPSRLSLLRHAVRPRAAPAGVGEPVRLRPEDRNRPGCGAQRSAADTRLAQEDVHEEDATRATGRSTASGSRATRSSSRSARRTCS